MGTHYPRQRTLIGNSHSPIAQRISLFYELFRERGAAQKGEIRYTVKLGISR
jgi:hypothetical protein